MLHHRSDFTDLVTTVGEQTGAGAAIVEKDYWVTEALRVVADGFADDVVFKGGTSLSKAWGLIRRFSEDIDLLVRIDTPRTETSGARERLMRAIGDAVARVDGLDRIDDEGRSERGVSRTIVFAYAPRTAAVKGLRPTIILELGMRGGTHPTAIRSLQSMVGAALAETGVADESTSAFEMTVLDSRRTLVEKLFAIHCACALWEEGRTTAIRRQSRHFSDIHALLGDPGVAAFVGSPEYRALLPEIDEFGTRYFQRDHRAPAGLRFGSSVAVAPTGALREALETEYAQSAFLFYGERPSLDMVFARLDEFRERL